MTVRHPSKRYCPLCKNQPTDKIGDYTYRCIRCGFVIDEARGQSAYHHHILVAKPSIVGVGSHKKYFQGHPQEPSRRDMFKRINKGLENPIRYDKDSMLNKNITPGKVRGTNFWLNVQYANLDTEAVTLEQQRELEKKLQSNKYEY